MSVIREMAEHDPLFAKEIEALTPEQLAWLEADLRLRRRAAQLAVELGADDSDVYHQLKHLQRSPLARLRLGLNHGRRRPRPAE